MSINNIILHLSLIDKVGPATIDKMITSFNAFKEQELLLNIYDLDLKDLIYYSGFKEHIAKLIYDGLQDKTLLEKELNLLDKYQIRILTIFDQDYPILLKEIYLPPAVLYIKADEDFKFSSNSIAVVGSRKCDNYGSRVVKLIIPELVKNNYDIVSGGAYGIDTIAHEVCLNNSGVTISVLGSGLLKLYPQENKKLFEKIVLNKGALISSFSLNRSAYPGNFPARNRIIAGLSLGSLVIQAPEKSGALITANYALDQGREVLAVPGPIDNSLSYGCHKLISQGAQLVNSAKDILDVFGKPYKSVINKGINDFFNNLHNNLSDLENQILKLIQEPLSFDELLINMQLSFQELQSLLFDMQIKGYITQNIMGFWQKV